MRLEVARELVTLFQKPGYRALREAVQQYEADMVRKLIVADPQDVAAVAKAQVRTEHVGVVLTRVQELAESTVLEHSKTMRSLEGKPI